MAEYVEVMNQKRRMCNSYALCSMGCPLNDIDFCNKNSGEKIYADFSEVERRTMAWAADHPEPIYPTWLEWLFENGFVTKQKNEYGIMYDFKWDNPIPADIAKKLGIDPKEG